VAQSFTWGTDSDKRPVLNVVPPNRPWSHFVRLAVIIAAEPELPSVVRGGENVILPSTAHVMGATKVTRPAPAEGRCVVDTAMPVPQAATPRTIRSTVALALTRRILITEPSCQRQPWI
jgi:hypothetical protein